MVSHTDGMEDELARCFWSRVESQLSGKSLRALCAEAGLNYHSIRNRKSGAVYSLPRIETGYQIAQALGVSLEFLITGKDTRPQSIGDRLYQALLEQAPAVLQGLIETYIEKRDTSSVPRMA